MNCSYRIANTPIYIGLRVRKTPDKKTVSFDNTPSARKQEDIN